MDGKHRSGRRGNRRLRMTNVPRKGFTLIEMVVVTAIIALMAALILPNYVAMRRSQEIRNAEAMLVRMPTQARNEAVRSHVPVELRYENDHFVIERLDPKLDPNDDQTVQTAQTVLQLPLDPAISVDSAQKNGQVSDVASWRWIVFPDGSASEAGLTFRINGTEQKSLWIPGDGSAPQLLSSELPDPTLEQWQAGDLEQRNTATTSSSSGSGGGSANARR